MIQDIHPHRFSNLYLANRVPQDDDYIFHYQGNSILLKNIGEELALPPKKDFQEIGESAEWVFLFTLNEVPCFLVWSELKLDNPELTYTEIGFFRSHCAARNWLGESGGASPAQLVPAKPLLRCVWHTHPTQTRRAGSGLSGLQHGGLPQNFAGHYCGHPQQRQDFAGQQLQLRQ